MPTQPTGNDSEWDLRYAELGKRVSMALRELLENKHLYQRVAVDFTGLTEAPTATARERLAELFIAKCKRVIQLPWDCADNTGHYRRVGIDGDALRPTVPHVKLFCEECDRIEAFNSVSAEDMLGRDKERPEHELGGKTIQVFALSYLCQSCKRVPEVMLVRREGAQLSLCGRSPMEHTRVPSAIPKRIARFYRDAVVAYQCGHTLSGLFMLRTLIEQWARGYGVGGTEASAVLDAYVATLPADFKERFSCFRDLYNLLSADLHSATGDEGLFVNVLARIDEHFEARRLFKLAEP
jgi:hypothetical protein